MQLAALVQARGGPDAVTFITAAPDAQAVWLATLELISEWEQQSAADPP